MSGTIKQAIEALKSRIADAYTAIVAKGGTLPATQDSANLPSAIVSIPAGGTTGDWSNFDPVPDSSVNVLDMFLGRGVVFDTITYNGNGLIAYAFYQRPIVKKFIAPLWQTSGHTIPYYFGFCFSLLEFYAPLLKVAVGGMFSNCSNLRLVYMPSGIETRSTGIFNNCTNLIDIVWGAATSNQNFATWNPTNALNASSQSLLTSDDIAAGFTSNLEKLLYNIREHIAANLSDRTGLSSLSISFSAAVKAAILADQPTADAFTNKNWIIA